MPKKKKAIEIKELPNTLSIVQYMHCIKCLDEKPPDVSPMDWSRTQTGFTEVGLQVWCNRHNCNIVHIHFEGQQHPANMTCAKTEAPAPKILLPEDVQ